MYPQYMCILLYVKLIWCNGMPYICCQYGVSGVDVSSVYCAFCYMWIFFGVMVFHRCIVNWSGRWGRCILRICAFCYLWNLFGVTVLHISIVNWSGGRCILSICASCYIWNLFGEMVLHRSIVNWEELLFLILVWYVFAIYMFLFRRQFLHCICCVFIHMLPWK